MKLYILFFISFISIYTQNIPVESNSIYIKIFHTVPKTNVATMYSEPDEVKLDGYRRNIESQGNWIGQPLMAIHIGTKSVIEQFPDGTKLETSGYCIRIGSSEVIMSASIFYFSLFLFISLIIILLIVVSSFLKKRESKNKQ